MPKHTLKEQYLKMDGANLFLLEHCEKTLSEIRRAYQGISHSVNRCNSEYIDCWKAVKALRKQADLLAAELSKANAAIGQFQERQDKIAAWLKDKFSKENQ